MLKTKMQKHGWIAAGALMLSIAAGPALAITKFDSLGNGGFVNNDITYGVGGRAFVTPLLYVEDYGNTKGAQDQLLGSGIDYSYMADLASSHVLNLTYTFTNNRDPGDLFPDMNGMRFMLDVIAYGSTLSPTKDLPSENWPAAVAGDPDKRRIQNLASGALNTILVNQNGIAVDGANNCLSGCTTDFALEWDRLVLKPGELWTVGLAFVDDPLLVGGGRWLRADSLDGTGNTLIFGNLQPVPEPNSYALLIAGLVLTGAIALRRARVAG